jgi:hypothetical protein
MKLLIEKTRRVALAAALAAGLGAGSAQAIQIDLDLGSVGSGWFIYDQNLVTGGSDSIGITDFFFNLISPSTTFDFDDRDLAGGHYVFFNSGVFEGFQFSAHNGTHLLEFTTFGDGSDTGDYGSLYVDSVPTVSSLVSSNFSPFPTGSGPAAVPEPETWFGSLLALGLVIAARMRRRPTVSMELAPPLA